jgi:hypothetical protein
MKLEHPSNTLKTENTRHAHEALTTTPETRLPAFDDFLALVEDETKETAHNVNGYAVYHKYNKSC